MTQDQYGQTREPGYVVRGGAIPEDENEGYPTGQAKPKTAFQKVASALRGSGSEQDEQDQTARRPGDYWDEPAASAASRDEAVAGTNPDVPFHQTGTDPLTRQDQMTGQADPDAVDHPATQPDMFGTTTHAGNGATSAPQADEATIPDVPVSGVPATGVPASGVPASGVPASGVPASGVPASGVPASGVPATGVPAGEATGIAGRHAAAASAGTESRPGEAAGTVSDFSDLADGNLIADAAVYIEQWQQVQFKFVDDPHASVTEAADIIAQVTARLEAAIQERQRAIQERQRAIAEQQRSLRDRWGEGSNADTEGLRETLRMYRTFLDQLIGPRAG